MVEFFRISYEEHFPHSSSNISVVDSGQDPLHSDVEREREKHLRMFRGTVSCNTWEIFRELLLHSLVNNAVRRA